MLAKVESSAELRAIRESSEASRLLVAIESLKGLHNIDSILREMNKRDLFAIGYEDLSAEMGIERPKNLNSINLLTKLILDSAIHARRHGVAMLDAASRKFLEHDLALLRDECLFTSNLGLSGKVCIHPSQISTVNGVWGARNNLMQERGQRVVEGFKCLNDGSFVIVNEEKEMMDTPSYRMYDKLLKSG